MVHHSMSQKDTFSNTVDAERGRIARVATVGLSCENAYQNWLSDAARRNRWLAPTRSH